MLEYIMRGIQLPEWAPPRSRYYNNVVNNLWLRGDQYKHIPYCFVDTKDKNGYALKLHDKRPSVTLNLPALGARMSSRRLFTGKHRPTFTPENEKFKEDITWLLKKGRIFWNMYDACLNGQAGSVAIACKLVDDKPVMDIIKGKSGFPVFDESGDLDSFMSAYIITGYMWSEMETGITVDASGAEISNTSQYWFIRKWDKEAVTTLYPVPVNDWNPEEGMAEDSESELKPVKHMSQVHKLGVVPVVWIRNMPDTNALDGLSSFGLALDNCITLDYALSSFGRGLNYMGNPQLFVKGKILNSGNGSHTYSMDRMLQVPADVKTEHQATSGADAKLLEMSGDGIRVGMEFWAKKLLEWTKHLSNMSMKDTEHIKGALSGTAMLMLDDDYFSFCEMLTTPYGDDGIVAVIRLFALLYQKAKSDRFKGIDQDGLDELEPNWPKEYEPEPQELDYLQKALAGAVTSGFMNTQEGSEVFSAALDKPLTPTEPEDNALLTLPGQEQDHGQEMREKEFDQKGKLETEKLKIAAKAKAAPAKKPAAKKPAKKK